MQFKDELNPIIWDKDNDNQMRPEVNAKLREIADAFIEYIEIPEEALIDVVVTGSSASYNYNEHSDLDLHIIVDYEKIHEDCPLVEGYLGALKNTFNKEHDIYIKDIPVELYAEKQGQGTVHNGLYSVWKEEWIDRPEKIAPTDNDAAVEAKYQEIKEMVDKCNDSETATELLEKIYTMRKAGLAEAGEFCTENLAFKKLRNEGCMDKLRQIKKEQIDKQLSLESYNESEDKMKELLDIFNYLPKFDPTKYIDFNNNSFYATIDNNKIYFYGYCVPNDFYLDKDICRDKNKLFEILKENKLLHPATEGISWEYVRNNGQAIRLIGEIDRDKHPELQISWEGITPYLREKTNDEIMDTIIKKGINAKSYKIIKETSNGILISLFDSDAGKRKKYIYKDGTLDSSYKAIKDFLNKNESIKESEDELTLEDKLINILTKDGWNHLNGRGGESLEKDNISISLYVDSVIFKELEYDEQQLPIETDEDLQNILNQINELKKNESVNENSKFPELEKQIRKMFSWIDGNINIWEMGKDVGKEGIVSFKFAAKNGRDDNEFTIFIYNDRLEVLYSNRGMGGVVRVKEIKISIDKNEFLSKVIDLIKLVKPYIDEYYEKINKEEVKTYSKEEDEWEEKLSKFIASLPKKLGKKYDVHQTDETVYVSDKDKTVFIEPIEDSTQIIKIGLLGDDNMEITSEELELEDFGKEDVKSIIDVIKELFKTKNESVKEELIKMINEAEGIYKPSLILEAYKKEQEWLKSLELGEDERAPEIMLFIIENDEIKDIKLIKREDVYTYKPEENEYYLDMFRDSGDVLTDYNLEPAQKLVDRWNEFKKEESMENKNEDVATLMDKVDAADAELKELIKSLSLREELESLIEKALEE